MLGFLLKVVVLVALIGGIGYVIVNKKSSLPSPKTLQSGLENTLRNFDTKTFASHLSASLDSLITNPQSSSPVVLGVKISNDSIGKVVDALQSLPSEQISQIRSAICSFPIPASPSPSLAQ